jgi:Holliday junction resolvase RusA-like endonuclease
VTPLDLSFWVPGKPLPKGNMAGFPVDRGPCKTCKGAGCRAGKFRTGCIGGRSVGVSVSDRGAGDLEAWESFVRYTAMSARNRAAARIVAAPQAVAITLVFLFERPASHWTESGKLNAAGRARPHPTVKPDFDKVTRAVSDGLTGSIVEDDCQVTIAQIGLFYALRGKRTGVAIGVRLVDNVPVWASALLGIVCPDALDIDGQERLL